MSSNKIREIISVYASCPAACPSRDGGNMNGKKIARTQSFKDFRRFNYIYIDKTEQIYRLIENRWVFISRPRRFGKSLMLDTIGTLFEEGVEPYFRNTWIYDKWTDTRYPVLRLNFLDYTAKYNEFCKLFCRDITGFARKLGVADEIAADDGPAEALFDLMKALVERGVMIVVLIDEYDTQLTASMDNPELYEQFRGTLRDLYGILKGKQCIRFLCVTGVTRLKDVSIFSVGSDIADLSYYSPVSTITGFVREEIRNYYADYLNLAASLIKNIPVSQVEECQREEVLDRLAGEYDGYCFDRFYKKKVFSTWSVHSFFREAIENHSVIFGDYWYDNGGMPTILAKYLETHSIAPEKYSENIDVSMADFWNPSSLLSMRQEVLMCQTGYLTVRSVIPNGNSVRLGVPNREVRRSLEKAMSQAIFHNAEFAGDKNEELFSKASAEEIVGRLNSLMNTISYEDYQKINEKTVQGMLHAFMIGSGQPVRTEVQSASGRSDIVLDYPERRLVLELKYAETEKECGERLTEAVSQIKERRYGDLLPVKREVLQIALVFNGKPGVRQFTHYKAVG